MHSNKHHWRDNFCQAGLILGESEFLQNVQFYVFNSPLDPRLESIEWRSFKHTNFYLERCLLSFSAEIGLCRGSGKDTQKLSMFSAPISFCWRFKQTWIPLRTPPSSPTPIPQLKSRIHHWAQFLQQFICRTSAHYITPRDKRRIKKPEKLW